jgi:hypothetical protein
VAVQPAIEISLRVRILELFAALDVRCRFRSGQAAFQRRRCKLARVNPILLISFALATLTSVATGQQPHGADPARGRVANGWMRVPTDASAPDPVLASVRGRRDQYWDDRIGEPLALKTDEEIMATGGPEGAHGPELPDLSGKALLIATFTSSRSLLTNSGRAIYSEASLRVTDVIQDPEGRSTPGSNITLSVAGGAVRTAAGVITFRAQPIAYYVEPNHTYFLVLQYRPAEEFYVLNRDWDLSTGLVKANTEVDLRKEAAGGSEILGLTKDQLIATISAKVAKNK